MLKQPPKVHAWNAQAIGLYACQSLAGHGSGLTPCDAFDTFWVLEDDVGFSGAISQLFQAYENSQALEI